MPEHPTPPASTPILTEREAIAAIIDPDIMSDLACDALGINEVYRPILRDKLLAKAGAILALSASPTPSEAGLRLEPKGCPTPGACSCIPDFKTGSLLDELDSLRASLLDNGLKLEAATVENAMKALGASSPPSSEAGECIMCCVNMLPHECTKRATPSAVLDENGRNAVKRCSCMEVHGEDPNCIKHGNGTEWRRENPDICEIIERYSVDRNAVLEEAAKAGGQAVADLVARHDGDPRVSSGMVSAQGVMLNAIRGLKSPPLTGAE